MSDTEAARGNPVRLKFEARRRVPAIVCAALLCGCASSLRAAALDGGDAAGVDVIATPDVAPDVAPDAPRPECTNVRECAGRPDPTGTLFARRWSCVVGRCTWEPEGGRTCYERPDGCIFCDGGVQLGCRGTACLAPLNRDAIRFESSNCSRDFISSVAACAGGFVRLTDGTPCVLTDAPTGAIRYVLSCGACEVVFMPR